MARNARAYWQTLFHPKDGTESDMLIRLILAPFDNVHSSDPENLPSYSATYAQPVLTPKMFMNAIALLDVGYLTKDLNFPESVMLEAFAAQYAILGLDHFEEGHLKRGGFRELVIRFIKVDPEHCFRVFNGLLGEGDVLLLDCRTEEPFVFKKIPRACFPEKPDQDVARLWHEKSKEAQERACEIFESYHDSVKQQKGGNDSELQLRLAQMGLDRARQQRDLLLGTTYYDSYGIERYQPGTSDYTSTGIF